MKTNYLTAQSCWVSIPSREADRQLSGNNLKMLLAILMLGLAGVRPANGQFTTNIVIPPGYVQVEGDVITTEAVAAELLGLKTGPQPQFTYAPGRLWPNRVVPYDFDSGVTVLQQPVFVAAMAMWANSFPGVTTVTFQPRNGQDGYVHFVVADPGLGDGTTDHIGYDGGTFSPNPVTITIRPSVFNGSHPAGLIAHEVGHALGLWHEQSRDDRDNYITILYANIQSGASDQFNKQSPEAAFGPYDYLSIMHYSPCAFTICDGLNGRPSCTCTDSCVTLEAVPQYRNSAAPCHIGQTIQPTAMDNRGMAFLYAPSDWRFLYPKGGSSASGSFEQPYLSVSQAAGGVPANGTLWIGPGSYAAAGQTISRPMTLKAALGDLQLQPGGSIGPSSSGYATLR